MPPKFNTPDELRKRLLGNQLDTAKMLQMLEEGKSIEEVIGIDPTLADNNVACDSGC